MPVARFEMPDGRIGRFEVPEGTTPENAQALIEQHLSGQESGQKPGFLGRVGQSFVQRDIAEQELANKTIAGQKAMPEGLAEIAFSRVGGPIGDVIGAALQPAMEAAAPYVPQKIKDVAGAVGELYKKIPERGRDIIEAGGNVLNIVGGGLAGKSAAKGVGAARGALKTAPRLASSDIKTLSQAAYKEAADLGGVLDEKWTNTFIDELQKHKPRPIGGKVFTSEQKKLMDSIGEYEGLKDTRLSLEDIQTLDETLGDKVSLNPLTGRPDKAGYKILELQDRLREMVLNAPESHVLGEKAGFVALDKARKLWSAQRAMDDIERIIERASMMDNEATSMKAGFRTLSLNKSRMRGYTPQEQALIKKAATGQPIADLLRTTVGSRLISTVGGYAGGGLAGAATGAAAGMAARGGAAALQLRKAQNILKEIEDRAIKAQGKKP